MCVDGPSKLVDAGQTVQRGPLDASRSGIAIQEMKNLASHGSSEPRNNGRLPALEGEVGEVGEVGL